MNSAAQSLIPNCLSEQPSDIQLELVLVIIGQSVNSNDRTFVIEKLNSCEIEHKLVRETEKVIELIISISFQQASAFSSELDKAAFFKHYDVALLANNSRKKKLLVCDMDSTIISSETLDEIAKHAGIGEQVCEITDKAMRGEIDFNSALTERVKLLTDMPISVLNEIAESTDFNPGAESLLSKAKSYGIRTVLVSGGFEPIVNTVAEKLGFDRYVCNRMESNNDLLTGNVIPPIVNSKTKLSVLKEECHSLNISLDQACTIGDGANDLPMIEAAGLGISYYGKPVLRKVTSYQINVTDLESALFMMGIID